MSEQLSFEKTENLRCPENDTENSHAETRNNLREQSFTENDSAPLSSKITKQYTMSVDANKCINCKGCEAACKLENMIYADIKASHETPKFWQRCSVEQLGPAEFKRETNDNNEFTGIFNFFMPCMHCEKPACVASCPVPGKALHKDRETGIVLPDHEKCIGCGLCTIACPYGAVRMSDRYNSKGKQILDKCTYCYHRVTDNANKPKEEQLKPACVTKCPSGALDFGIKEEITAGKELLDFDKFGINPSTSFIKVDGIGSNEIISLLINRKKTTSSDKTDLVFDPRKGMKHCNRKQYGPHLYKNDNFAEDGWRVSDFDWENYHVRADIDIEKGEPKWT